MLYEVITRTYLSYHASEALAKHNSLLYASLTATDKSQWNTYSQPANYTGPTSTQASIQLATKLVNNVAVAGQHQRNNFV